MSQDTPPHPAAPPAREPGAAGSDAAPKATAQGGFGVPKLVSNVATELGSNFGISSVYPVPACLLALSGAVGNSLRLRSRLWPSPLNAALQLLFVDQTKGRLSQAIDFSMHDLSHLQDEGLRELSVSRAR